MILKERVQSFQYLFDSEMITNISDTASIKTFKKHDVIIDIPQNLDFIPLLINGNIKGLREDENGDKLLIYVLETGDTCAMSLTCCMTKSVSKIKATADEDVTVIMMPIANMRLWFNTNESWRNFILQSYQVRFDKMLETIDTLAFLKMDARLLKYLRGHVKLTSSITLEITEDLHTSRVVISRVLKQLEKEHEIELGRNKISVLEF